MAENIVASLFGLNPQMYGEQQRRSALSEGIALAQLDPAARGAAMTYAGARGLGNAIGGALGAEDPQLKMISARNTIAQQIDQSDPESILKGAQMLAQMGDQQGAMALAQYARQAQGDVAQTKQRLAAALASEATAKRERQQATPNDIQIANEIATLEDTLGQIENLPADPERTRAKNLLTTRLAELRRLTSKEKPEAKTSYGAEADRASKARFGKNFSELTQAESKIIDDLLEERGVKKAKESASKLILPGDKTLADIPAFRASVQRTIDPQLKAVTAADNALENIQDSIDTNNFASFRAAQTQFARAISGSGDLSQKELLAAGADPSLLGGTADYVARLFTSTPTLDTQEKIKKTLLAIKKVSTSKAKTEIEAQRKIAYSNPGYEKARVDQALDFPEFSGQQAPAVTGDLAAQARALLKQRQEGKK
jgi:hypothetical protein